MKAPAFDYVRPNSLDDLFSLLDEHGESGRVLAGGQTLLATLNMRLSEPGMLIDIGSIESLKGISVQGTTLRIGALATHTEIEGSHVIAQHAPLLAMAAPHIAHRAIRNRGTWGGSIAYADPAAEWPACVVALQGVVVVQGANGERRIPADDFFVDLYTTALADGEVVTACELPVCSAHDVFAFDELARRHGDYAVVGLAMAVQRNGSTFERVRLAFLNVGTRPFCARRAEAVLEGQTPSAPLIDEAIEALKAELDPLADLTHSAAAKRHLACVLARRALQRTLVT